MAGEDDVRDGGPHDAQRDDPPEKSAEQPGGVPPRPSGPAPVIDLGEDAVPVRPAKPLGPRRLARLQRELAERARELEEAGGNPADPGLLDKQRRFAELAAQAGAAQHNPAGTHPVTGTAVPEPVAPDPAEPRTAAPEEPPEPLEQITVVFPGGDGSGGPEGHVPHDPVHVDPSLFSNRLAPEDLATLTHIQIVAPGDTGAHGSHAHPAAAHTTAEHPAGEDPPAGRFPAGRHEDPGDAEAAPPAPAGPAASTGPAGSWAEAEEEPPAGPVPAVTAGGLELLEPREYRRRAGIAWWVLLLSAVLAALAIVLVLFLL